ncbi:MAG: L,D-transpeptidase family protein [Candidatus Omnitrophica bacterium]|nr:L,D-transpeptidase family protein [Candidatus Omnitrophota bacterium]
MTPRRWLFLGVVAAIGLGLWAGVFSRGRSKISPAGAPQAEKPSAVSPAPKSARLLMAKADRALAEGNLLEAKRLYQEILQQEDAGSVAAAVQGRLGEVNLKLLLSPASTPASVIHTVASGDTLTKIAKKYGTTIELLMASNGLTSDRIRPGQPLKVSRAQFSLVVDKSQNTLTLKDGQEVLKVYRCSTGKGGITPEGTFTIVNRIVDPPWFTPEGIIPPGDSRNILGTRWLGFNLASYGIHGTTDPASIGRPVTQGCVRLTNSDVEELYALLPEGTLVTIVE